MKKGKIIYSVLIGSRAYGTHSKNSDYDYKHVFIQKQEDILLNGHIDQVNISKDEVAYEIKRFCELLSVSNPTVLEMLFVRDNEVLLCDESFKPFREYRFKFLSKMANNAFAGYAKSQIRKAQGLNKKMNWEKDQTERKTLIDFCYIIQDRGKTYPLSKILEQEKYNPSQFGLVKMPNARDVYGVFYDESFRGMGSEKSNQLRLSSIPKEKLDTFLFNMIFNLDAYSKHCRKYKEYKEWLKKRNEDRYTDIEGHDQKIDGKNLMHCIRLLTMAKEIAIHGNIFVWRKDAHKLLNIKTGKVNLQLIIEDAELLINQMSDLYQSANLPVTPNRELIKKLHKKIRECSN